MSQSPLEYLHHILDEVTYLQSQVHALTREQFLQNETAKRAFVRSLEVIGEAAKKVPLEFRQANPDIEWRAITGMRDRLIHDYFGVDYEIVWDVVMNKLPSLRQHIDSILRRERSA
jgi:uncharacterized protein with HEPN domain